MEVAPLRFSAHHERTYVKNRGATVEDKLGLGQILDPSDAFGGVGARFSGPWHGCNLLIERFLSRDYGEFPPAVRAKARLSCPRLVSPGLQGRGRARLQRYELECDGVRLAAS